MLGSVSTIEAVVKALDDEGTVGLPLIVDPGHGGELGAFPGQ